MKKSEKTFAAGSVFGALSGWTAIIEATPSGVSGTDHEYSVSAESETVICRL